MAPSRGEAPASDVPDPLAAIAAGRDWLERHAPYLLPDALVFAEIGLRAAQLPLPRRLKPPGAGRIVETVIPLSPAFRTIAAATGPLYLGYRGEPPRSSWSLWWSFVREAVA
jgi:hypothetical protein